MGYRTCCGCRESRGSAAALRCSAPESSFKAGIWRDWCSLLLQEERKHFLLRDEKNIFTWYFFRQWKQRVHLATFVVPINIVTFVLPQARLHCDGQLRNWNSATEMARRVRRSAAATGNATLRGPYATGKTAAQGSLMNPRRPRPTKYVRVRDILVADVERCVDAREAFPFISTEDMLLASSFHLLVLYTAQPTN
jgi:hypothetical protein